MREALLGSLVLAVSLSSCASSEPAPRTPPRVEAAPAEAAQVTGRVLSPDGGPVRGATVALVSAVDMMGSEPDSVTASTDAAGAFAFAGVVPGHYAITATAPGFSASYGGPVDVAKAAVPAVELHVGPSGLRYAGRVLDERGPVAGARVSVVEFSPRDLSTYVTFADAQGRYAIDLAPGVPYFGFIAAPPRMRTFEILSPEVTTQDFVLDPAPVQRPADDVVRSYLDAHALPIATDDPAAPADDLAPVVALAGPARIVAIGEVTHGSREIFRLRHRLTAALLEREGGVFGVEAGYAECRALEAYIQGGAGEPTKLLRGLVTDYMMTEEWSALIQWMRAHNADPKKPKIHFEGFDVTSFTSVGVVVEAAKKALPARASELEAALAPLSKYDADGTFAEQPKDVRARAVQAIADLRGPLAALPDAAILGHHLDVLEQATRVFVDRFRRDPAMAVNVDWLLARYPKARVVLSMHDSHASRHGFLDGQLGRLLARAHGDDYVVIGTGFARGGFRSLGEDMSKGVLSFHMDAPVPGSLDEAMALAAPAMFALDLRHADGPVGAWLDGPMLAWNIGFRFVDPNEARIPIVPKRTFDILVFAKDVTAARAL